jgi:hypothetical protein
MKLTQAQLAHLGCALEARKFEYPKRSIANRFEPMSSNNIVNIGGERAILWVYQSIVVRDTGRGDGFG